MKSYLLSSIVMVCLLCSCTPHQSITHPASPTPALRASAQSANTSTIISTPSPEPLPALRTIFLIVMENHNWSAIEGNKNAQYINKVLLPMASFARNYRNPPGIHPSEPNYIWLEAGTSFDVRNDGDPQQNHQTSTDHLVTQLSQAGISWKSYQEDISGADCPLYATKGYAPKHNPMIYFDDVTATNDPRSAVCISHIRPYTELTTDLAQNTVARYNFITPNLCHDMHGALGCDMTNAIKAGDSWLAMEVPKILASSAYQAGGVLFITWDEGESGDGPIGLILLSPLAKGGGYTNSLPYTHSSTLRTIQELFGVKPLLGDAANAKNLSDLFRIYP